MMFDNCGAEIKDPNQLFCLNCRSKVKHLDKEIQELFDSGNVRVYVDDINHRIWIWKRKNSATQKKFKSVKLAPNIQDRKGIQYEVVSVQEGNEPSKFLDFIQEK